jgi:hypothetical protein
LDGKTQSQVLYAKNTLDEPMFIQCFYRPLGDINSDTLWCEKEPIAWSAPILLNVGERKLIMDYVKPVNIKIYRSSDTSLLLEVPNKYNFSPFYESSNDAIKYSKTDEAELGNRIRSKSPCIYEECYYMKNSRYLLENVPWDIYPIYFDQGSCIKLETSYWKYRKENYVNEANGYAIVSCIVFDKGYFKQFGLNGQNER